ncbi:hypothetical protein LCGC14_1137750 [marine sediment metagenome]|uniref:Exonuclease domain-containing protein n=1 Tax=marine sediment metagenome TaxID=412755 RepID=A0A0F9PHE1_9ZZZZ
MSKIMYVDVETTGLEPSKHSIVQLAGIIEIDDVEKERFNLRMRPKEDTEIDPRALEIIGKTTEELMTYPHDIDVYPQLLLILHKYVNKFERQDKMFFVAYNANFDMQFVRAWFEARGDVYFGAWFFFPPIDIMTIAANEMMEVRAEMTDFKLHTVCKKLGLEWDELAAHDAMYDIEKTMEIHSILEEYGVKDHL